MHLPAYVGLITSSMTCTFAETPRAVVPRPRPGAGDTELLAVGRGPSEDIRRPLNG
ncbi:MAG: hypothetical protein M3N32_11800 [Actinomycetota bacterium]|nr:hypothetical protein [Actinomycetota bacterium]